MLAHAHTWTSNSKLFDASQCDALILVQILAKAQRERLQVMFDELQSPEHGEKRYRAALG